MGLTPGTRIGVYEITALLGEGGMGEVYRATDGNLKRRVAIKVLPASVAGDADRLARFQREAEVLAALNHPNIAAIYGLEKTPDFTALVMELVEGNDLSQRIAKGAIPLDEALPIAKQIADALEAAHEQGIIHRDLKPANIKVRADGTVKVLDFGLAKVLAPEAASAAAGQLSQSPTITTPAMMTGVGMILGTAAYMAPEQAKGRPADKRSDLWAFGCVLYEMLTGRRAFGDGDIPTVLARVMEREPDWSRLPPATPRYVRVLLRRCLQKDTRMRLQAIAEARIILEGVSDELSETDGRTSQPSPRVLVASVLAGLLVAAATGLLVWNLKPAADSRRPVTRFTITLPPGQQLARASALALSADGRQLAYVATQDGGTQQIYLYAMETGEARPLSGTEGATGPFFNPDTTSLGFFAGNLLKRVSLKGVVVSNVTEVVNPLGATWTDHHTIVFAPYAAGLQQVSDAGGVPQALATLESGETTHARPRFLQGANAVLFGGLRGIAVQDIATGKRRALIDGQGLEADYIPVGHLVYLQSGNLIAAPVSLAPLEVKGEAVQVVQDVLQYTVSATGSLAYVSGRAPAAGDRLVWVTRTGMEHTLPAPVRGYYQPRVEPVHGNRVSMDLMGQVWLYDITRDQLSAFTFEGQSKHSVWTPDGKRLAFMSNKDGTWQTYWQGADGSGQAERLTNDPPTTQAIPYSWSSDGMLAFAKNISTTGAEFSVLAAGDRSAGSGGTRAARSFLRTRAADGAPQFSPDGHWLVYAENDDRGQRQIYVQDYPGPGGKHQVSIDGGNEPVWNPNGRELFYRSGDKMMTVKISAQPGFVAEKPEVLFERPYQTTCCGYVRPDYDVSPDGQRFLMVKPANPDQTPLTEISVVENWSEEMKQPATPK